MHRTGLISWQGFLLITLCTIMPDAARAAPGLQITQAKWSKATGQLTVKGKGAAAPVELYDTSGRLLGAATPDAGQKFQFKTGDSRPGLLCGVRAKSGNAVATRKVAGVPNPDCVKAPQCLILSPANGAALTAYQEIPFQASARLKDRKAGPLKVEWDFGGGARRFYTEQGRTTFERDNSRYQVRFTAWDGKKRYCEDQIAVTVGTPPTGLPAKVAEQAAPSRGAGLGGEVVVLPFNDMAMQSGYPTYDTIYPWESINNLNAQVIRKGSAGNDKPRILTDTEVGLRYSAASNPHDPVGPGSINSTSQNWPLAGAGGGHHEQPAADIQKTDAFWGSGDFLGAVGGGIWWLIFPDSIFNGDYYETHYLLDEGYRSRHNVEVTEDYVYNAHASGGQGSTMPGIAAPYQANDPQKVKAFLSNLSLFTVEALPLSDIDDQGRVNSFPLMRVEATDKASGNLLASADAAVTHGSDMSCRECHLKGGLGADPGVARQPSDFNFHMPTVQLPTIYEPLGQDIIALEKAALLNANSLHTWYNMKPWFEVWGYDSNDPNQGIDDWMKPGGHSSFACFAHHSSTVAAEFNIQQPMNLDPPDFSPGGDYPPLSKAQHGWHGRLQQDAQGKLLRDENGNPLLWGNGGTENPQNPFTLAVGRNPNTLFPTDGDRPMEDNCLKCHAGKREQLYRDHHYTVGLKCADCHGDLLAVSQLLAKPDGSHRQDWLDQPNCGSCHSGNGAEAVAKKAYDPNDPSATTLPPKSDRFAVRPATVQIRTGNWKEGKMPLKDYTSTAFRHSRDSHANLACAACHGPGHALWPNRDPKANDNVTALQLQGFPGSIMECNVCHTKDAFAKFENLDGGQYTGLPADSGILGGPHGLHPMRDKNWWQSAKGDNLNGGGWHDNVYRRPGLKGEDQCAACHGVDHQGTRLSKTPVDLSFKLANGGVATWKAGEEVGCNKCHTLDKSFRNGPKGL